MYYTTRALNIIAVILLTACANTKRVPPSEDTLRYLERVGLTNEPAVMYDAMETKIFTLGIYDDTSTIPLSDGTTYQKTIHVDTTGYKEVFRWALDTAADGARGVWGGVK